jgi:hypothetical protein
MSPTFRDDGLLARVEAQLRRRLSVAHFQPRSISLETSELTFDAQKFTAVKMLLNSRLKNSDCYVT